MLIIVDYGIGNLTSIKSMVKKAGFACIISNKEIEIAFASKLPLPGMGHFNNCMHCCPKRFSSITNFVDFTAPKHGEFAVSDFYPSVI